MKIWSYVKGIVERNSLSGNWIASLDREVIKKSGYNGEAFVLKNNGHGNTVGSRRVKEILKRSSRFD